MCGTVRMVVIPYYPRPKVLLPGDRDVSGWGIQRMPPYDVVVTTELLRNIRFPTVDIQKEISK